MEAEWHKESTRAETAQNIIQSLCLVDGWSLLQEKASVQSDTQPAFRSKTSCVKDQNAENGGCNIITLPSPPFSGSLN